jgi:transposase
MTAKLRTDKISDYKKGESRKNTKIYQYYTFPLRYAAKMLDLDYSTISRYKKCAEQHGFIKVFKQFERIKLSPAHLDSIRKYLDEDAYCFVAHENKLYLQKPDVIQSKICLKYKKRIRYPCTKNQNNS